MWPVTYEGTSSTLFFSIKYHHCLLLFYFKWVGYGTYCQVEGEDRLVLSPHATIELQLDLKANNTQNGQKIELDGSLTNQDLKKPKSSRWVGGTESWRWAESPGVVWSGSGGSAVVILAFTSGW